MVIFTFLDNSITNIIIIFIDTLYRYNTHIIHVRAISVNNSFDINIDANHFQTQKV